MVSVHTLRRLVRKNPGLTSNELYDILPDEEKGRDLTEQRIYKHHISSILSRLKRKGEVVSGMQPGHPPHNRWFPSEALKND